MNEAASDGPLIGHCEKWGLPEQLGSILDIRDPIRACAGFEPNVVLIFSYMGPLGWIDWINTWRAIRRGGVARYSLWIVTENNLVVLEVDGGAFKRGIKRLIGRWPLEAVTAQRIRPRNRMVSHWPMAMIVQTPAENFEVKAEAFDEATENLISLLCD